jgi:hypothetical protein
MEKPMEKKYIITEKDLNGLLTIIGDSTPSTLTLDQIFGIHNSMKNNLRDYIEQTPIEQAPIEPI